MFVTKLQFQIGVDSGGWSEGREYLSLRMSQSFWREERWGEVLNVNQEYLQTRQPTQHKYYIMGPISKYQNNINIFMAG